MFEICNLKSVTAYAVANEASGKTENREAMADPVAARARQPEKADPRLFGSGDCL